MKNKILPILIFLCFISPVISVESPTKLKTKKTNWRIEKASAFADGSPEKIIFFAPSLNDKKELPVKEMLYNRSGRLIQETDLMCKALQSNIFYHGPSVSYDEKGRIAKVSFYYEGILNGMMKDIYPNGAVKKTTLYKNGVMDGPTVVYFDNGEIAKTAHYVNDKLEGEVITYYPNGLKESHLFYEKSVLQNEAICWFDDGAVKSKKHYLYGLLNDTFSNRALTEYYQSSILGEVQSFTFGIPSGPHIKYHPNGREIYKVNYKNGAKVGLETTYSDLQDLIGEGEYSNGKPIGKHYLKNQVGILIYQAHFDEKGFLKEPILTFYETGEKKEQYTKTTAGFQGDFLEWHPNSALKKRYHYLNDCFDGLQQEFYENGKLKLECLYANGKKIGTFKEWFENGQITSEIQLDKGKRSGLAKTFYENGQIKSESFFNTAGNLEGVEKYFEENGQLVFEGLYSNGLKSGIHQEWYKNGVLKKKTNFLAGKIHGSNEEFYENGALALKANYVDNFIDGDFINYFEDSTIHEKKQFEKGKPIGIHLEYHQSQAPDSNNVLASALCYSMGKLDGVQKRFYKNGKPEVVLTYKNNILHGLKSLWSMEGNLLEEATYLDGDLDGRYFLVKDDGTKIITNYKNNLKHGAEEVYYPLHPLFGEVKAFQATYEKGLIQGEAVEFNEAGTKIASTTYENGLKNGPALFYHPNETLMIATEFKNDEQHGLTSEYYVSGNLKAQVLFIDDLKTGEEKSYFDGAAQTLATSKFYKKGILNGLWQEWNKQGALVFQAEYYQGKRNGLLSKYTPDGVPYVNHRYEDDILIEKFDL